MARGIGRRAALGVAPPKAGRLPYTATAAVVYGAALLLFTPHTMRIPVALALAAALALSAPPPAAAQATPRGERKQARADRRMERAHTIRHGESLHKKPRLVREENKLDHRRMPRQ